MDYSLLEMDTPSEQLETRKTKRAPNITQALCIPAPPFFAALFYQPLSKHQPQMLVLCRQSVCLCAEAPSRGHC